jgi:DNA mismatch repair ATPase MutS
MNLYYDFFMNPDHNSTILYSFYLNQYNTDMISVKKLIDDKKLNPCKFKKYTKMKKMYYLPHIDGAITNDVGLKKNLIISGPNASGKTTVLKSIILNALLSQQFGCGCYKSARIKCYDTFHSYLNIPDTSGRDSLFQAEARRCKDIMEFINTNPNKTHLCIFDELYSGTNPSDAVMCATLYLNNMNNFKKNVDYLITTHYVDLCKSFETDQQLYNMKMKVIEKEESIEYLYKLVEGISTINGGKYILKQLDL